MSPVLPEEVYKTRKIGQVCQIGEKRIFFKPTSYHIEKFLWLAVWIYIIISDFPVILLSLVETEKAYKTSKNGQIC